MNYPLSFHPFTNNHHILKQLYKHLYLVTPVTFTFFSTSYFKVLEYWDINHYCYMCERNCYQPLSETTHEPTCDACWRFCRQNLTKYSGAKYYWNVEPSPNDVSPNVCSWTMRPEDNAPVDDASIGRCISQTICPFSTCPNNACRPLWF